MFRALDHDARPRCAREDADLWFATDRRSKAEAVSLCLVCPVAEACLKTTIDIEAVEGVMPGIRAGLNEKERRAFLRSAPFNRPIRKREQIA